MSERFQFEYLPTFWPFYQNRFDNFSLFYAYSFLEVILVNCQEMELIELFQRSLSRSEMSGLAHFHIIINIIQW